MIAIINNTTIIIPNNISGRKTKAALTAIYSLQLEKSSNEKLFYLLRYTMNSFVE